jgi:hypothetical protein
MKKPPPNIPERLDITERIRNVTPKIVQTRAPLQQKQWDAALASPLPRTISYELLNDYRTNVLQYLDWVTQTMILCDEPGALRAIQHAADRLTRIAAMTPDALKRGIEDGRLQLSDDVPF